MVFRRACIGLCFWVLSIPVTAQFAEYQLQFFDYPSGIRSDEIVSLGKDQKGVLWILYRSKVQLFDGKEAQTFSPAPRLNSLLCDKKGHIWVCSEKEVFLFSEQTGKFDSVKIGHTPQSLKVGPVIELQDGRIWMITNLGFFQFDESKREFHKAVSLLREGIPFLTDVLAHHKEMLFFHGRGFIYRYNLSTAQLDSMVIGSPYDIFPISEDSLLVNLRNTSPQWYRFSTRSITKVSLGKEFAEAFTMRHMTAITPTCFLIASANGIIEYDANKKVFLKQNFFLNGRKLATKEFASFILYDQQEGYVWLATTDGIARFALRNPPMALVKISQMNDEVPAIINDIRKIVQDEEGNLWMATGYGFVCWKKEEGKWILFPPASNDSTRLSHESIRGMVYDGKYLILGPTNKGLWLYDIRTGEYRRPVYDTEETRKLSETDFVNEIATLHNGNHIILADHAIYILDGKTYHLKQFKHPAIKPGNASFCAQGGDDIVWIATASGIYCFDREMNYLLTVPEGFRSNAINYGYSGFIMKDNGLLLPCATGLYALYYENGTVRSDKITNLFDQVVLFTVYMDNNGVIWASSENGIYRFDPRTSELNLFDRSDNIQGYGFNSNSGFRDRDGLLYFGGLNGVNYWQPETFSAPNQSFETYISKVGIGNVDYSMYAFDTLKPVSYSDRSLSVSFASVYFNNPAKIRYRYKLSKIDDEWKDIGNNNVVRFSSLSPGSYTLMMEASLNRVDWKKAGNSLSFQILQPFWMSWWFISGCILLTGIFVGRFILDQKRKIKIHKEDLETAQAINYFSSGIYGSNDIEKEFHHIAESCIERLHYSYSEIYYFDWRTHELKPIVRLRSDSAGTGIEKIPVVREVVKRVATTGKAEIIADATRAASYDFRKIQALSEIAVPIITDGKVWGIIYGGHIKKDFFSQKQLSILITIASLCANKIIKTKAEKEKAKAESVLMDTRQKMAEAEMQALRAQMNPHFIFNCLNSINRYIVKSDQATASLYLTRFARLIRLILDNSNSQSITLASELEALRLYVEMESIRFEKKFNFDIHLAEDIYPESIYVPPLIIQPYVENAIWHGLLHKDTDGCLSVRISRNENDMLQCIIEDNGVGRDVSAMLRSKTMASKKSLGMQLTESRLVLLSRQMGFNASVQIEDLKGEHGEPLGTKVTLNIPVD